MGHGFLTGFLNQSYMTGRVLVWGLLWKGFALDKL